MAEQAETGATTVVSPHDARAQRALLLEDLLERRDPIRKAERAAARKAKKEAAPSAPKEVAQDSCDHDESIAREQMSLKTNTRGSIPAEIRHAVFLKYGE